MRSSTDENYTMISINRLLVIVLLLSLALSVFPGPQPVQAQTAAPQPSKTASSATASQDQLVSIDFNNVDIVVFIKFISDLTKRNFVVDEKVRGKVTIISPGKITVAEAYKVFQSVLEVNDLTTVPAGEVIKIVRAPDARSKSIKTRLEEESGVAGDNVVTQIIPLHYADPNEIKKLFTPLVSKSSVILSYPPTNTLIVTDVHSNIKRLIRILKAIDITGVGQQIAIIPVEYADATKLVTLLTSIFKSKGAGKGVVEKDITFVADERTNSIVLLASEGDTDNIRKLIKSLDKETPKGQAKIHVYYLEHASAEDLAKVLQDIPEKSAAAGQAAPGKRVAPVISGDVRISADKATNSLIIMADMEDYIVLEGIIRKIDIPRSMVYIEALIMEVNVTRDFRLGTEYLLGGEATLDDKQGVAGGGFNAGAEGALAGAAASIAAGTTPLVQGFSLGLFGENIEIDGITFPTISSVIQAFKRDNDVHILSTPQILTTDNQEAKISVGSNVPFQTSTTASTTGSNLFNSFEYRDVGTTLKITPHISLDRMVRLELSLEVSDLTNTNIGGQPVTLKRTVETTAIVLDGNTVVLGGLIDEQLDRTVNKVPCLGDIPLLGLLFSTRSDSKAKSNLYIFLTPRVIQSPNEATQISSKKRGQIDKLREEKIKLFKGDWFEGQTAIGGEKFESPAMQHDGEARPTPGSSGTEGREGITHQNRMNDDSNAPPGGQASDATSESGARTSSVEPGTTAAGSPVEPETNAYPAGDANAAIPNPGTTKAGPPSDGTPDTHKTATGRETVGITIQVGAVQEVQLADRLLKQLKDAGYPAYTVQNSDGEKSWYRVRVGYFDDPAAAEEMMQRLRSDHYDPIIIYF